MLAAVLLLAACQTAEPPRQASTMGDKDGAQFRERRGWAVSFAAATDGAPAHCVGRRGAADSGLRIVFIGAERESGFRLLGVPVGGTERDSLSVAFDNGDHTSFDVRRDGDALIFLAPTAQYEDLTHPFARARSAALRLKNGAALGELPLTGSSWAINATDECRRMNVTTGRR